MSNSMPSDTTPAIVRGARLTTKSAYFPTSKRSWEPRAVANGLITLRQSGLVKILEQITTIEGIARETSL